MEHKIRSYTVAVFEWDEEPGYWAEVLDLPGCVAQGETLHELRNAVSEAIEAWEETWEEMTNHDPLLPRRVETMKLLGEVGDGELTAV